MSMLYYINGTQVYPLNAGLEKYTWTPRNDIDIVLEKKLTTEFIFNYTTSGFDFKQQERRNISEELTLKIVDTCGAQHITNYEGLFAVCEGTWDDDKCLFTVRPRSKDYVLNDVDVNIFSGLATYVPGGVFTGSGGNARNYENAFDFGSVIYCLAKTTNERINKVVSNFFQINPDGAFYLPGTNYWANMAICPLSDVQEPIPTNRATFEQIKFNEFMKDLNSLFDVFYFIDPDYNLRVEHRLYFEGNIGLDLTQTKYKKYLLGSRKYKYNLQAYPDKERFAIVSNSRTNFAELTYNQISDLDKSINQQTRESTQIRTDYVAIRVDGKNSTEDGLFLFACEIIAGEYHMYEQNYLNYALTPDFLVNNVHKWGRPYLFALYNSFTRVSGSDLLKYGGYVAESLVRSKKYDPVQIPFCCGDEFNSADVVKTPQGYGYVDKAEYDNKTKMLSLELSYQNTNNYYIKPNDLSGLAWWIKADEGITYDGGTLKISQVDDFSGNSRHLVQANPTNQFLYDPVNKKILLQKPGYMLAPAWQLFPNKRGTLFVLTEMPNPVAGTAICILSTADGTAGPDFDFSYNGISLQSYTRAVGPIQFFYGTNDVTGNKSGLYSIQRLTDTLELYHHNGNIPYANTDWNPQAVPNNIPLVKALRLGDNQNIDNTGTTQTTPLKLLEIILYDRTLSESEVKDIEFYLAKKGTFKTYPL